MVRFGIPAAILLVAGAVVGWWVWLRPGEARGMPAGGLDPRRIAVLYFEAPAGADSLDYVADGLTEALIHELSRVPQLQVISSNGVRPFREGSVSLHDISRQLNVGSLVYGGLAQSENRLRVNVSLTNGSTGVEIGSKVLERPRTEIFALQDDLAKEVSAFLRVQLGQAIELRESRAGTRNSEAWELLQKAEEEARGTESMVTLGDTGAAGRQFRKADSLLARAEAKDPKWVQPITLRGWLAYRRARMAGSVDKAYYDDLTKLGLSHAERALAVKADDADALELRGTLQYWRWLLNLDPDPAQSAKLIDEAERDLRASVAANSSQASAWTTLSHLLLNRSQNAEAKLAALRAYEADPYLTNANLTLWRLFTTSLDLEDAVEARHWCAEGRRRFASDPRFAECQIWLFALKGQRPDVAQAWTLLEEYVQLSPPNLREYRRLRGQMIVAMALARAGLKDSARALAERSRADASLDPDRDLMQLEALARVILDDRAEALRLLSTYVATSPQKRAALAKDDTWWLRDLRADPGWKSLVGTTP